MTKNFIRVAGISTEEQRVDFTQFQMIKDYKTDQNIKSDVEVGQARILVIKENTDCKHLKIFMKCFMEGRR